MTEEICVIGTAINPVPTATAWSGIESLVTYQCKGFVELGVDVTLVSVDGSLWKDWDKINLIEVPVKGSDVEKSFYEGYKEKIRDFPCVIDNTNGKMARLANKNIIQVSHWLQHPVSMAYRNVVCISKAHARWTKSKYREAGIKRGPKVVHNGIDPSMFPFQQDKGDEFLFFSVLGPYKGADIALEIAKEHPEFKIGFGGRNTTYTNVVKDASKEYSNVVCYGEVDHDTKKLLMGKAKALLQPAKPHNPYEQYPFMDILPMTIIESGLCGTPGIGLAHGGVPEIIAHGINGFVCKNKEEMVEAMRRVEEIKPKDCREHMEKNFGYIRMCKQYLQLSDQVASGDWW